jgi:hypothetical protein
VNFDEISWASPLKRAVTECKSTRWFVYVTAGHHYLIEYQLTERGILKAARAVFEMAKRNELPLSLEDAAKIFFCLEIELAVYEGLRGAA